MNARLLGLVVLLSTPALGKPPAVLTPQRIAERTIPSVALIRSGEKLGTGFVVRADGRIATNLHVIAGAREVVVAIGEREYPALDVVAVDAAHDLAILRIAATKLPVLVLGDSDRVQAGQPVVAIGHPLGLGNTVSNGLISALREVEPGLKLLQVSAPISPGSSGGPLLSETGEVIGVSTLVTTAGQNLNFGMPINDLKRLLARKDAPQSLAELAEASAPKLRRSVPHHEVSVLEGCAPEELAQLEEAIGAAIELGAPLYNQGNHEACFRIYESAILELDRSMAGCGGARAALKEGVEKAQHLSTPTAKAWALRDAFDGVLEVISRKAKGPAAITRAVPRHPLGLVSGCSDEALRAIAKGIVEAIDVGAPLFNQGKLEACYRVYQGTALELARSQARCAGAREALEAGLTRAAALETPDARAWAMRDAFDGLLEVIRKRGASSP